MSIRFISIGAVRRQDLGNHNGALRSAGCLGLVIEEDGTWTEIKSDGERWVEERKLAARRAFDAKVRSIGYVDRVTGERIYDPDRLVRAPRGDSAVPKPSENRTE